ncbi:serine/threonine-protein kinase [Streptomyces jumonjinensis]|uniref:Serine/threonine protein kinase n=1 Tax=Streptomyces jumonjinensis TaxID=1945 RepID=A0A646KFL9_STRJU|nr:serine/threonine-protein kinase [Streptomyces jumonjinensis]MQT01079.1 serine/threonine protein kinase [Streptomyces jumonjinensis]
MPPLRNTGQSPEAERPEYAGHYRLESCLGTGGMGVVHLATSASGRKRAVKVIHAEHAADPEVRARFRQEVTAARRVSGAFTASVVDADPEAGRPWMATLFIDARTLSERVKRSPLDVVELRRMGAGLAEALRDIHRAGVVHRDLKPSNVLLAPDGPKVIDFGISRPTDSDLRTETGKLIGTPPFMAPEQFQRPREVGPAADVFAMGSVLVHAATGRGPFDSDSPYIVAYQVVHNEPDLTGVPTDLVPLLRRCLAKDPEERPTPYEVMVALRKAAPSSSYDTQAYIPSPRTPDPRESAPEVAEPRRRRGRWLRWAALGAAAVVAATAGIVAVRMTGDEARTSPAARTFTPWSVTLRGGDDENRTPVCAAGPGLSGLYCAAPGVKAALLDPDTGKTRWSLKTPGGPAQADGGLGPLLAGGLLQVIAPGGDRLEALDPKTGDVRWAAGISSYPTVRHIGDAVLLVSEDGRIRALDSATGKVRWEKRHGGVGTQWVADPDGSGRALGVMPAGAAGADGSTLVMAVDTATGKQLWQRRLDGELHPLQLSGDALYLRAVDRDGFTYEVVRLGTASAAADSRRVRVPAPLDQAQGAVVGDVVYLSGAMGSLVAIDTARGEQLWRRETGASYLSRPTAAARTVYVTAADGRLLAVDARRGVLAGQTEPRMDDGKHTFAPMLSAPVVEQGRVYGTAPDGSVFGVPASRPEKW